MGHYEVMTMSDRDGWCAVVHEYRAVAEFEEKHACFAQEMADRLNVRQWAEERA